MYLTDRLPRETGRDYALRTIKENIIRLELAPGSMVSENELAAAMGLSRTPVREALIELSKVRIVEIYPQRGSSVALIDPALVEEARFMRRVMECAVAELACTTLTPEWLARLQENVRLQNFYIQAETPYPEMLMSLDDQFHELLFGAANKPQTFQQVANLSIHFERVRSLALSTVKDPQIVRDHEALLDAIVNRNPERARRLMETHLGRYAIDVQALQEQYPDYFKK